MIARILFATTLLGGLAASPALAQDAAALAGDVATPGDVLTYGMGYGQQRFTPLEAITKENVKRLVPVWSTSLSDDRGQEAMPLVTDGRMYVTTHNATVAIDAKTGRQIWRTAVEYPQETPRVACCGIVNRGAAIWDGKLYRTTLDANVVALDAATGKEIWKTNSIDFRAGYAMTVAPLIVDGIVIVGISGGEYGIRGYIEGYDAQSGERKWRTYTIPEPGQPGSETWKDGGDAWKNGGGPAWLTGSYDPELGLVYWGVGNASPWNAGVRPGDNLYTGSILALDPKTGAIKWHYQATPNDPFDYDATNELVLAELDGRKVLMQANRNGFFYVLDRTDGKLVAANKYVDRVDWADSIDLATGRPKETEVATKARSGEPVVFWPSAFGGKNWSPMAYDPDRKLAFINTLNIGMNYKAVEPQYRAGTFYFGAEFTWDWPQGHRGALRAVDPMTGAVKWEQKADLPRFGGVMATKSGLVFTGSTEGMFEAFDADSGERLWGFQTGSGIIGQPISWEMDGRQFVTVLSGWGGVYSLFSGDERLATIPTGGSVWTFALPAE